MLKLKLTITSPLTKERDETVDCETISGGSVLEQRTVIPPSLIGTVEFQMSFVFPHLQLNPLALRVAISVPFCEESLGLLLLAVGVEPLDVIDQLN